MHTWVRGHWIKGLTHKQCCKILQSLPDFQMETSRLEKWWIVKGHGAVKTTPCTPETVEVEYDWGKGKYEFRNHINTKSTKLSVYRAAVLRSLGRHSYISRTGRLRPPPIPRRRHWRFIRRANDYLRAYSLFRTPNALTMAATAQNQSLHALIEKSRKTYQSHRCVGEQDHKFCAMDDPQDQVSPQDDELCATYLTRDRPIVSIYDQVNAYLEALLRIDRIMNLHYVRNI